MDFDDYQEEDRGPSRTALKREAEALQKLGEALVALPAAKLSDIPISEELADAIVKAQGIKAKGGRRRQLQFIGKLMRREDPGPIQAALDRLENRDAVGIAQHHQAERWRSRLLEEGDAALTEFLQQHPDTDPQRLRQLIRSARKEQAADKPARSAKELFRLIRAAVES